MHTKIPARLVAVILSSLLFTACGGGGGGNTLPVANAGTDQAVDDNTTVTLDASASTNTDGGTLTYAWAQSSGPSVTLSDPSAEKPTFVAPVISGGTSLTFDVTVSDASDASDTDSVTITVNDVTPAVATLAPDYTASTPITWTFNESMDPESLQLSGTLAALGDGGAWSTTNVENDTLALSPVDATSLTSGWESGVQTVGFTVADTRGNVTTVIDYPLQIRLVFENFQPAENVIGQLDFVSGEKHRGGAAKNGTFAGPHGNAGYDAVTGLLFLTDYEAERVLAYSGIPAVDGADAVFVVGQPDFTTVDSRPVSATSFSGPGSTQSYEGRLVVADNEHSRIVIYDNLPSLLSGSPAVIGTVLGQNSLDSDNAACSQMGLSAPVAQHITPDGKLIVADIDNHRVMIWNTLPEAGQHGAPADIVLGQENFDTCESNRGLDVPSAESLSYPSGIWSDGQRLVVLDYNNRALLWNVFPTESGQAADHVIGQKDFTLMAENDGDGDGTADEMPSPRTLSGPYVGVHSNGVQLFITDSENNRVLIWNNFPTQDFQLADAVLGQPDFVSSSRNLGETTPTASSLNFPSGVMTIRNKLVISDYENSRFLVFESR
ncbi:MAG TPA: hypothetical protein VF275_01245 [Gammaproteobacteria bacterium]